MDKTVSLSDKEIKEIIFALSNRAVEFLSSAFSCDDEGFEYGSKLYRKKAEFLGSILLKFDTLIDDILDVLWKKLKNS